VFSSPQDGPMFPRFSHLFALERRSKPVTIESHRLLRLRLPSSMKLLCAVLIFAAIGPKITPASLTPVLATSQTSLVPGKIVTEIKPFIEKLVLSDKFSGVIIIAKDKDVLFEGAYGRADQSSKTPNRVDTKFNLASVTQTFTAVAIAQLAQQGKVSFESTVSKYLPSYPGDEAKQITIHQLLTHTAGMGDVTRSKAFREAPIRFKALSDYLALVQAEPLIGQPGREYSYGNADCVVLAAIIERVSGQGYYDYVREHVFKRAGMKDSGFDLRPSPANLAIGYTSRDLGVTGYPHTDGSRHNNQSIFPTIAAPGAAAYSTGRDLLSYARNLQGHRLLGHEATENLLTGKVVTGQEGANRRYGYGFFDGELGKTRIVNHGGTGPGIDVGFYIYPDMGYVVIILANYDPPAAQQIRNELRAKISGT
jgi:D-alanyl-D-alanine carboxypeptidase